MSNTMANRLRRRAALQKLFKNAIVIMDHKYSGVNIDYLVITTDRCIEVKEVFTRQEFINEMAVVVHAGKIHYDKHHAIQNGKFISNGFYFLADSKLITANEIPAAYGLITYSPTIKFKKEALWIDPEKYIDRALYKRLFLDMAERYYQTKPAT